MQEKKFLEELDTLQRFFSLYCGDLHKKSLQEYAWHVEYRATCHEFSLFLCPTCHENFEYALQRLRACPHEPKPRCRKCEKPCYEKEKWKALAKVMRYSGIKLKSLEVLNYVLLKKKF